MLMFNYCVKEFFNLTRILYCKTLLKKKSRWTLNLVFNVDVINSNINFITYVKRHKFVWRMCVHKIKIQNQM